MFEYCPECNYMVHQVSEFSDGTKIYFHVHINRPMEAHWVLPLYTREKIYFFARKTIQDAADNMSIDFSDYVARYGRQGVGMDIGGAAKHALTSQKNK